MGRFCLKKLTTIVTNGTVEKSASSAINGRFKLVHRSLCIKILSSFPWGSEKTILSRIKRHDTMENGCGMLYKTNITMAPWPGEKRFI